MTINTSLTAAVAGTTPGYVRWSSLPTCGFKSSEKNLISNRNIARLQPDLTIAKSTPKLVLIATKSNIATPFLRPTRARHAVEHDRHESANKK
jgi:hypothetical protein